MDSTESTSASLDLTNEIDKKLSQAKGICWVIRGNPDAKAIDGSISDSLWAVDELIDAAKKAVDELYETIKPSK